MRTTPDVTTADGISLQAEMYVPAAPQIAVVIAHPNPLMGGDMYTPVPAAFFGALLDSDCAAIRFNFRGVGASGGSHDKGVGEKLDLAAIIDTVASAAPDVPLVLSGWSWGADLSLTSEDPRVAGWFMAAPPLKVFAPDTMAARLSTAPKVLAIPERDQFNPPANCREATADWTETSVVQVDDCDHFFGGQLDALTAQFLTFVTEHSAPSMT